MERGALQAPLSAARPAISAHHMGGFCEKIKRFQRRTCRAEARPKGAAGRRARSKKKAAGARLGLYSGQRSRHPKGRTIAMRKLMLLVALSTLITTGLAVSAQAQH